jgi:hypothetical protein
MDEAVDSARNEKSKSRMLNRINENKEMFASLELDRQL